MSVFKDKVLLITGGTGSFGNAVLRRFLNSDGSIYFHDAAYLWDGSISGCGSYACFHGTANFTAAIEQRKEETLKRGLNYAFFL